MAAGHAISRTMSTMQQKAMIAGFTTAERDYIRRNLDQFFSTLPTVADGFLLKTWRSGPQAGQPKVPLPAKVSMAGRTRLYPARDASASSDVGLPRFDASGDVSKIDGVMASRWLPHVRR